MKMERKPLPSLAEAIEGKQKITATRLIEAVQGEGLNEFKGLAIQLLEQYDSVQLVAAALQILTGEKKEVQVDLTPEDPLRAKKRRPDVNSTGRRYSGFSGSGSSGGSGAPRYQRSGSSSDSRGGYKGSRDSNNYRKPKTDYKERSSTEGYVNK